MIIKIPSLTFSGIDIVDVDVQVKIEPGIPKFTIVGLADKTIAESKERVRAALSSIGLSFPAKKILINLAPADLEKEGSHFDLAISVGILAAMGAIAPEVFEEYLVLGELSLDGAILPVNGVLPAAMGANARDKGIICSNLNGSEAAWSGNDKIVASILINGDSASFASLLAISVLPTPVDPIINMFLGTISLRIGSCTFALRYLVRKATATAFFAAF